MRLAWRDAASQSLTAARIAPRAWGRSDSGRGGRPVINKSTRSPRAIACSSPRSRRRYAESRLWPWRSIVLSGATKPRERRRSQVPSSVASAAETVLAGGGACWRRVASGAAAASGAGRAAGSGSGALVRRGRYGVTLATTFAQSAASSGASLRGRLTAAREAARAPAAAGRAFRAEAAGTRCRARKVRRRSSARVGRHPRRYRSGSLP